MHRRNHLKMLAALLSGSLAVCARALAGEPPAPDEPSAAPRRIRYAFSAQNQSARVLEQPSVLVHAPVRQTSTQRVEALSCTQPSLVEVDVFGNQTLRVQLEPLAPYATRVVTIDAQLAVHDAPRSEALPSLLQQSYRVAERYVEAADPRIKALVPSLKSDTATHTAKNVFDCVRRTLRADEYQGRERGAVNALQARAGACADHAYLFTALMRAAGYPARVVCGYIGGDSALLRAYDFHTWAEFHDDGAWRLADAHQGRFMREPARYIAMRIVSSRAPGSLEATQRYRVLERALEIRMG